MNAKVKIIRDPVHGYIPLYKDIQDIVDTPTFQRLRRIRHLPAEPVYPGTTHTRFEHSLGVMFLGLRLFNLLIEKGNLNPKVNSDVDKCRDTVKYACLLHDVGHTPLSHVCEEFGDSSAELYDKYIKPLGIDIGKRPSAEASHEWQSAAVSLACFGSQLSSLNVDLELFCRMIFGVCYESNEKPWLNPFIILLNSWTDVDKIDYILRDSKMSGAVLANLDSERILSSFDVRNDDLIISKSGFSVISQLINGREALYLWLYTHHAVAYYHSLIRRYIKYLKSKGVTFEHLFSHQGILNGADDNQLHNLLWQNKDHDSYTKLLHGQIYDRKFYISLWKTPFECEEILGSLVMNTILNNLEKLESDLIKDLSLPTNSVFAYDAGFAPFEGSHKQVWLSVGKRHSNYAQLFHKSIYKQDTIIDKTPYVRISRDIIDRKDNIIEYLKRWRVS